MAGPATYGGISGGLAGIVDALSTIFKQRAVTKEQQQRDAQLADLEQQRAFERQRQLHQDDLSNVATYDQTFGSDKPLPSEVKATYQRALPGLVEDRPSVLPSTQFTPAIPSTSAPTPTPTDTPDPMGYAALQSPAPSPLPLNLGMLPKAGQEAGTYRRETQGEKVTKQQQAVQQQILAGLAANPKTAHIAQAMQAGAKPSVADFQDPEVARKAKLEDFFTEQGIRTANQKDVAQFEAGLRPKEKPEKPPADPLIPIDTVDAQGNHVVTYKRASQVEGQSFPKPVAAGGGGTAALQGARAESAITMLDRLQEVHKKLQSGEGPGQLVRGIAQATGGRINLSNAATEYQKLRRATAVALAVAIQGSRPSDADAEAMAQLLPDFTTPAEVAKNLFDSSRQQLRNTAGNMANAGRQPGAVDNRMNTIDSSVQTSGPAKGTRRVINRQPAVWDGQGWLPEGK